MCINDYCEYCYDGFGNCIYFKCGIVLSYFNILVMKFKKEWFDNFKEGVNSFGLGVYIYCFVCGFKDLNKKV